MGIFTVIGWAIFGLIVGLIARFLVPGRQRIGLLRTMALGIAGSLAGGLIVWLLTGKELHAAGWIMSVVGAVLVILIYTKWIAPKGPLP